MAPSTASRLEQPIPDGPHWLIRDLTGIRADDGPPTLRKDKHIIVASVRHFHKIQDHDTSCRSACISVNGDASSTRFGSGLMTQEEVGQIESK